MFGLVFSVAVIAFIIWLKLYSPKLKGRIGEAFVNRILSNLDQEKYTIFHDVYVPSKDGKITQIDHIVTSPSGIYVIETKHFEGWIFGNEDQKYWTQVIYKRKEKLYNPIWQNKGHVQALSNHLELDGNKFHSIIAFSNKSTLKFKDCFIQARVIQFHQLLNVIKGHTTPEFSQHEYNNINRKIAKLANIEGNEKKEVKKAHLEHVKSKKQTNTKQLAACPKCQGALVLRKGKYGSFQGCSNYPKCRYTKQTKVSS